MMWGYYGGWAWLWMTGVMLFFAVGLVVLAVWAVRVLSRTGQTGDPALETLRRRLAAGEISQEDYEKTRRILQG